MQEYRPVKEGKVRELYDIGDQLIMVATDRISAFDYILKNTIPDKGKVLTQMSRFWFDYTKDIVPNHMISIDPAGLKECEKLPEPIFTPSTKAEIGIHDENINFDQCVEVCEKAFPGHGADYAAKIRDYTIALYRKCADYALSRGIIIADTKFEFGVDEAGSVVIADEMLTPDSSRFWPLEGYEAGHGQPSFDKQFVRNWLKANPDSDFRLPEDVVEKTSAKYREAFTMISGKDLA